MSTTTQPLKYLWTAVFEDGHIISQSPDDRYSKHDDTAEWNPSAFRDIQEYECGIEVFSLGHIAVNIPLGLFAINENVFSLESEPLSDRKLIYYREMQQDSVDGSISEPYVVRYAIGYEGKNSKGKVEKKVIFVDGK